MTPYPDATPQEVDEALRLADAAVIPFRNESLSRRRALLHAIATGLESASGNLSETASRETHLGMERLKGEVARTCWQLRSYSDAALAGHWLDARIDTGDPKRSPGPKPDLRKMMVPLGSVVVFGSSNFPFAYSTAGGDTACALASGCPVVVKGHPGHPATSEAVSQVIREAVRSLSFHPGVFGHVHGAGFEVGKALVTHPLAKAVGFTGSFGGGKALFDWAAQRKVPIPVFSEMGSVNPVFLLPKKLREAAPDIAAMYASSITQGVGQFCTNPGLIIGLDGQDLERFISALAQAMRAVPPALMLHQGIAKAFSEKREAALSQKGVTTVAVSEVPGPSEGLPTLASVSGKAFLENPLLHQEVFGPYSLVIRCSAMDEMLEVARHMEGQLTTTLMATDEDWKEHPDLVEAARELCGRLVLNGVPTGVEVVTAMQHGGPFPATTDSRFTSVGSDGIRRFTRPLCYQNFPDHLLPEALQNANPLGIWRLVDGGWKR